MNMKSFLVPLTRDIMTFIFSTKLTLVRIPLEVFCILTLLQLGKHFDDLNSVLSLLKCKFHIIGITEHKIHTNDVLSVSNIDLDGYHPFVFDATETTHGGTGFFISDSLAFKKRDDLKFNSPGNYESTFIEVILPKRKNMILGCIYRHPTSTIPVHRFNNEYILPLLEKISIEDKLYSLMGDFNIDLLKHSTNEDINTFYNSLSSHFIRSLYTTAYKTNIKIFN